MKMYESLLIKIRGRKPFYTRFKDAEELAQSYSSSEKIISSDNDSIVHKDDEQFYHTIERLIHYFADIKSIEPGSITFYETGDFDLEVCISGDAQQMLSHACLGILSYYDCKSMSILADFAEHFGISLKPKDIFFRILSSITVQRYLIDTNIDRGEVLNLLQKKINDISEIILSIMKRTQAYKKISSDSAPNGFIVLYNTLKIVGFEAETYINELKISSNIVKNY
jgi:hypothetical protein